MRIISTFRRLSLRELLLDDRAAAATEYAVLLAVMVIAVVGAMVYMGTGISGDLTGAADQLPATNGDHLGALPGRYLGHVVPGANP